MASAQSSTHVRDWSSLPEQLGRSRLVDGLAFVLNCLQHFSALELLVPRALHHPARLARLVRDHTRHLQCMCTCGEYNALVRVA